MVCDPDLLRRYLLFPDDADGADSPQMSSANVSAAVCGNGAEFALELAAVIMENVDYQAFADAVSITQDWGGKKLQFVISHIQFLRLTWENIFSNGDVPYSAGEAAVEATRAAAEAVAEDYEEEADGLRTAFDEVLGDEEDREADELLGIVLCGDKDTFE